MGFKVRDWVYLDDLCCYGQIVEIKDNLVYVEYNTGTGGGCMTFNLSELKLSGEDAISFANSLFRPTREEIEHHNELIRRIDENIKIERCLDGFEAEIADLDLSFLNEISSEKKMNVEVIKDNYNFRYATCPHCKSELRVKKELLTYTYSKRYNIAIIACPCCNKNIMLREGR